MTAKYERPENSESNATNDAAADAAPEKSEKEIDRRQFPCQNCGAAMTFIPGTRNLQCPYCGAQNQISEVQKNPDGSVSGALKLQELDFLAYLDVAEKEKTQTKKISRTHCNGCGANIALEKNVSAEKCPYCGVPVVVQEFVETAIAVQGVLPFQIKKERAYELYGAWLSSLWFAPNNLTKMAMRDSALIGVYTPYWTYDSVAVCRYIGERGEHYYVTESYTTSDGKRDTRQVQKTRWYPASGTVTVTFDDVLIPATKSLPRALIEELEPWTLTKLTDFAPEFLSGYRAETYQINLRDGFALAQEKMNPQIYSAVVRDIGGDEQRVTRQDTEHHKITFKHVLLPIWISAYRYSDRTFRFVINGDTGEVQGERPYSWVKITLLVIVILVVVYFVGGYLLANSGDVSNSTDNLIRNF